MNSIALSPDFEDDETILLGGTGGTVYMSDNGGGGGGRGKRGKKGDRGGEGRKGDKEKSRRPLTGGKGSLWEGGIRVPLIIRGPGVRPDSFCGVPVVGYDLFPTYCALAGVKEPLPKGVEGGSIAGLYKYLKKVNAQMARPNPQYDPSKPPPDPKARKKGKKKKRGKRGR
ncbi:hypothetical protein ES703_91673 [subsurface metagenome]